MNKRLHDFYWQKRYTGSQNMWWYFWGIGLGYGMSMKWHWMVWWVAVAIISYWHRCYKKH